MDALKRVVDREIAAGREHGRVLARATARKPQGSPWKRQQNGMPRRRPATAWWSRS